jgi:hypothetical protein
MDEKEIEKEGKHIDGLLQRSNKKCILTAYLFKLMVQKYP